MNAIAVHKGIRWHVFGRQGPDRTWQLAMAAHSLVDAFRFCISCDKRADAWDETEIVPAGERPHGRMFGDKRWGCEQG